MSKPATKKPTAGQQREARRLKAKERRERAAELRDERRNKAIAVARREYQDTECEIDDCAKLSDSQGDGGTWVAAWVWVNEDEINAE